MLITGVAGAGKTTIASQLNKLGYDARNMDSINDLSSWVNLSTGESEPNFKRDSADAWIDKYDWLWNEKILRELLRESSDAFFCGSSGNQDKFYPLFGRVILLEMDDELIKERVLENERDHTYGRMPGELEAILGYYEDFQNSAKAFGAKVIDARKPIDEIINIILSEAGIQP